MRQIATEFKPEDAVFSESSDDHRAESLNKLFTSDFAAVIPSCAVREATQIGGKMLIFWDQRLVFLATPKAGSTAVAMALESLASVSIQRPATLKHTDIAAYRRHVGPWLQAQTGEEFTTVALMREPVEWLRSWYRFKLRDDHEDPLHLMEGLSFADFADRYVAADRQGTLQIGSQASFLCDAEHQVDRIFPYEQMDEFIHFLEDRLDCAIELPRINVPPAVDVSLPPAHEERLRDALRADMDLYRSLG